MLPEQAKRAIEHVREQLELIRANKGYTKGEKTELFNLADSQIKDLGRDRQETSEITPRPPKVRQSSPIIDQRAVAKGIIRLCKGQYSPMQLYLGFSVAPSEAWIRKVIAEQAEEEVLGE